MTTITLPPDIEKSLAEQARERGTTPELLAINSLRAIFAPPVPHDGHEGDTLYDFLLGYVGTIDGTTEALSEHTGQRFTEGLVDKQRQGRL